MIDEPHPNGHQMNGPELESEILELTLAWQQGVATNEERARLEYLLADSVEARRLYASIASDTVALAELAEAAAEVGADSLVLAGREASIARKAVVGRGAGWSVSLPWLAAAAAIMIAILWGASDWIRDGALAGANGQRPLARIVQLEGVEWTDEGNHYNEWSQVYPGDSLSIKSGMVELVIDNVVQLVVKGPADLRLVSERKAVASSGQLVARAGPEGIGFEVVTPHASVVDQGTVFGISITPQDQTDVVVYDGTVDVAVLDQAPSKSQQVAAAPRRLETGEALRIGRAGKLNRITTVDATYFLPPPQIGKFSSQPSRLIASVSDSVNSLDTTKYYRIVGGGLTEDCHAFVDRLHQWNGVDSRGLPPFLRGADYVMAFNDDKVLTDLQIAVELTQPASLFVLWDDRVPAPQWLTDDFVDTGWDMGLDEGYVDRKHGKSRRTAIGAGNGVDFVFSVWRRDVLEASSVMLGALGTQEIALPPREVPQCMYGIAATPLVRVQTAAHGN